MDWFGFESLLFAAVVVTMLATVVSRRQKLLDFVRRVAGQSPPPAGEVETEIAWRRVAESHGLRRIDATSMPDMMPRDEALRGDLHGQSLFIRTKHREVVSPAAQLTRTRRPSPMLFIHCQLVFLTPLEAELEVRRRSVFLRGGLETGDSEFDELFHVKGSERVRRLLTPEVRQALIVLRHKLPEFVLDDRGLRFQIEDERGVELLEDLAGGRSLDAVVDALAELARQVRNLQQARVEPDVAEALVEQNAGG